MKATLRFLWSFLITLNAFSAIAGHDRSDNALQAFLWLTVWLCNEEIWKLRGQK